MVLSKDSNARATIASQNIVNKSITSQSAQQSFKQSATSGQENRRPILQRVFGSNGTQGLTTAHQTNSVGPASRGAPSSK